jgi:hypothetical protein
METNKKAGNGLAITALVLGIVAFCLGWTGIFGLVLAVLAVVFGIIALVQKQSKGMGITGLVLGAIALVTALFITLAGLALLGGAAKVANDVNQEKQAVKNMKKDFAKGETGVFDKLSVQAVKVTPNFMPSDGYSKPDAGKQFVFVSLKIKNTSNETVSVNPFDFKLNDNGASTDYYFTTSIPAPLNATELKPGAALQGDLVFQANASSKSFKLEYKTYSSKALEEINYSLAL